MKPVIFEPFPEIADQLEEYLTNEVKALFAVQHSPKADNGVMEYKQWSETPEGRIHMQLMYNYVLKSDHIDAKMANRIQRQLQSQGKEARGRPRLYDPRIHNWTIQRRVRIFLLNKLVAQALGVDTAKWEVPLEPELQRTEPEDVFDALARFEEWSGLNLPRAAWLHYTRVDRMALRRSHPELPVEKDEGIGLAEFKLLRAAKSEELTAKSALSIIRGIKDGTDLNAA